MSWLVAHSRIFKLFMKGKFDAYVQCTAVTFGQTSPKLNSRPVYCSRLYGTEMADSPKMWPILQNWQEESAASKSPLLAV